MYPKKLNEYRSVITNFRARRAPESEKANHMKLQRVLKIELLAEHHTSVLESFQQCTMTSL